LKDGWICACGEYEYEEGHHKKCSMKKPVENWLPITAMGNKQYPLLNWTNRRMCWDFV
jgi:hypothetical protein